MEQRIIGVEDRKNIHQSMKMLNSKNFQQQKNTMDIGDTMKGQNLRIIGVKEKNPSSNAQ